MKRRDFLFTTLIAGFPVVALSSEDEYSPRYVDVIVVGAGAGGLTAAYSAALKGASVLLLEKMPKLGGDTFLSGGYFNAVLTPEESSWFPDYPPDSIDLYTSQINQLAEGLNSPKLARTLAENSRDSLEWLKKLGIRFLPTPYHVYGGKYPRSFLTETGNGRIYIQVLAEACLSKKVQISTNSRVITLIKGNEENRIVGVIAQGPEGPSTVFARKGVVLASGGFGANSSKLREMVPWAADLGTDSNPGATGDLHDAVYAIGGKLTNMHFVECVPGSSAHENNPVRLDYNPRKFIFVNENGKRFVNEELPRGKISGAYFNGGFKRCYSIVDNQTVQEIQLNRKKNVYKGLYKNMVWRGNTVEELARKLNIPEKNLFQTIQECQFDKQILTPPFWAANVVFKIHLTLGGVEINETAQVLDEHGKPITGLWACGQIIGNLHGKYRLGGNGINCAVVFGRLAAKNLTQ